MAIGTKTDFVIYQEQFFGGLSETLEQETNVFNEASNGALRLISSTKKGDYEQESFLKSISGLVSRRDITSTAGVTDLALTQDEFVSVKINRKIGPVANTRDSFRKIARDPGEFSFMLGQQWGKNMAVDMVNTAVTSAVAALSSQATATFDATATGSTTMTHKNLVNTMAKLGDQSQRIVAWVMNSKSYFDLVGQAITDNVFQVGGAVIYSGTVPTFGRPVIVTDSPALTETDGGGLGVDNYWAMGLVQDAVMVQESEDREIVSETVTGLENLVIRIQGEYAYNLAMLGYKWDIAAGSANPADAALGTGSNWDLALDDVKSRAGVIINHA